MEPGINTVPDNLYWSSGPFEVGILPPYGAKRDAIKNALSYLEQFRSECQIHYMAFNGVVGGRAAALEQYRRAFRPENVDAMFSVGTQFPGGEQSLGKSTIAQIKQGRFS